MSFRNFFFAVAFFCLTFELSSCASGARGSTARRLTVLAWNAQTFFDAIDDGSEFKEFSTAGGKWSLEKYETRLDRLVSVILLCGQRLGMARDEGPDIVVLEEIENERVVYDACNRIPRQNGYRYAAFVPPTRGSAFASAILSRYPILSVTAHGIWSGDISTRPLLEASIAVGAETVRVFAVHWKSKIGDSEGDPTDTLRARQEILLRDRILKVDDGFWVACGDFNQSLDEFTILREFENPWEDFYSRTSVIGENRPLGSYFFRGSWESIDHFFYSANGSGEVFWRVDSFEPIGLSPFADESCAPIRYEAFSGTGYSDHLPIGLTLAREN